MKRRNLVLHGGGSGTDDAGLSQENGLRLDRLKAKRRADRAKAR